MDSRKFIISVGKNRKDKSWKREELTWADVIERCTTVKPTRETMAEYAAMSNDERSNIKDVGGFVAGELKNGRRKKENVLFRSLITLDLDYVTAPIEDLWAKIDRELNCAALIYTTHNHTPEKPRARLIIPTSRDMARGEYEPVARKIAEKIGVEQFDTSTYQEERLMYWPSASSDAKFYSQSKDAAFLNPDDILSEYKDWNDCSAWPVSSREGDVIRREIKRAGDPLEKPGLIGAFCRAYTIEDAIDKFLFDVYAPTTTDGRYSYINGSTAGGLVTYDGKFAYSHHDSDPASRRLCNAFDLVRLHKFEPLDEGRRATDVTRLPSYKAMQTFAGNDIEVLKLETRERLASTGDFEEIELSDDDVEWQRMLTSKNGKYESTSDNVVTILEHDPALKGKLWFNVFTNREAVNGKLPWPKVQTMADQWTDLDDANLRVYLERHYGIRGRDVIKDARMVVTGKNARHPIVDYLSRLTWDGVPRLDRAVISVLGAEDNELNRAMTRKHFTAAVKRVMEPGCKYDQCFVLTGPEGTGKSTFFEVMGGEWFNDSITTTEGKEGMEALQCSWIIEWSELTSIKRSAVESIKAYLSKREDRYRKAYGENSNSLPRQCVFCATTNEVLFLKGDTGNRRFWVIEIKPELSMFKTTPERREYFEAHRDQLWAEAVYYYKAGEKLYLNAEESTMLRNVQEEFSDESVDTTPGELKKYLDMPLPEDWNEKTIQEMRAYVHGCDMCDEDAKRRAFIKRETFCIAEFVVVYEGVNKKDKSFYGRCRAVAKHMRKDPEWQERGKFNSPQFGEQRCWIRIANDDEDL